MRDLSRQIARLTPAQRDRLDRLREGSAAPAAISRRAPGTLELSFAQRRMWFLEQLAPGSAVNTIAARLRLVGALDAEALQRGLSVVVARHEVLRTAVREERGEPRPCIEEAAELQLARGEAASEEEAAALLDVDAARPIDLARAPLLRATLVRVAADLHLLGVVVHHLAADALSMRVLFDELGAAMRGEALAPLPLQYADFASHQLGRAALPAQEASVAAWKARLACAPVCLDPGLDRPRPRVLSTAVARVSTGLGQEAILSLASTARALRATTFMVAAAALAALLGRAATRDDVVIGTAVAGRPKAEAEGLIGPFLNSVALRLSTGGDPSLATLIERARAAVLEAFEHQDAPFERVVAAVDPERSQRHAPIFQTLLILNGGEAPAPVIPGISVTPLAAESGHAAMDLSFVVYERPGELRITLRYATALFDEASARTLLHGYAKLLEAMGASPDRSFASVDLLDEGARALLDDEAAPFAARSRALALLAREERRARVLGWTDTPGVSVQAPVHRAFLAQAGRTPDALAVVGEEGALRYGELELRSRVLAGELLAAGIGPGSVVAILVDRSAAAVVAMLAVLRAGAAYAPMDADMPRGRLARQLEDAGAPILLARSANLGPIEGASAKVIAVDREREARPFDEPDEGAPSPERPAYVIFTSGSTGTPKGVVVSHASLSAYVQSIVVDLDLASRPRACAVASTLAADLAVTCLFPALATGGSVHLLPRTIALDGAALAAQLAKQPIDVLKITPSHLGALMDRAGPAVLPREVIVLGGEQLPWTLIERIEGAGGVRWINEYGPTEATVGCVALRREEARGALRKTASVPSGRPMPGARAYVLDERGDLAAIGAAGELFVGGRGVALGYLGREEETSSRFVNDPFAPRSEGDTAPRMYATGDRARWLPGGFLAHLGRADEQVKIRGYRIEPAEIAAALRRQPSVEEAAVIARGEENELRLVAYVVPRGGSSSAPSPALLRERLREDLFEAMIPSSFVFLDALPLGSNGKLDRAALPSAELGVALAPEEELPASAIEETLAEAWRRVLGVPRVGRRQSFFDIGGHSLLAARLVAEIAELGHTIPLAALFDAQTIEAQAALIAGGARTSWPTLFTVQARGARPPLFCVCRPNVNALGYIALARHLGDDQPVYGLQQQYRDETEFPYEIEEYQALGRAYLTEIRKVCPAGPYRLLGMCEGAHIAFEIVRLLEAAGEEVSFFAPLDAWPVENTLSRPLTWIALRMKWAKERLGSSARPSVGRVVRSLVRDVRGLPARLGRPLAAGPHVADGAILRNGRTEMEERLHRRYWPGPGFVPPTIRCPITVFRVRSQLFWRVRDEACGWGNRTSAGVSVVRIAGEHETFLREPHVRDLARKLREALPRP